MKQQIQTLAAALHTTGEFLADWQGRPYHHFLKITEPTGLNYMVLKDGQLVLWARTVDNSGSHVFIHSRKSMVKKREKMPFASSRSGFQPRCINSFIIALIIIYD